MPSRDLFDRIMQSLAQAMLDEAHWPATSALIDEACGMRGNALVIGLGHARGEGEIYLARFCSQGERREEQERRYFEVYYPRDERLPRLALLPHGRLTAIADLYTAEELKDSATYNEGLPQRGCQKGLNVRLDGPDGPDVSSIVWTLMDSTEAGGWGASQTAMIERLLPHLRHFVAVRQALVGAQALRAGLAELLDNGRIGVIHLDRGGAVVAANDRAVDVLRRGDGLLDDGGALRARLPADDDRLQKLLARALPRLGAHPPAGGSMTVRRVSNSAPLGIHVSPLGGGSADLDGRRVAAWVVVVDPARRPPIDPKRVSEALGLTPSESRVAALLSEGRTVKEVARSAGFQEDYVRWLLKQAYRKGGLSGQVALASRVLAIDAMPWP